MSLIHVSVQCPALRDERGIPAVFLWLSEFAVEDRLFLRDVVGDTFGELGVEPDPGWELTELESIFTSKGYKAFTLGP